MDKEHPMNAILVFSGIGLELACNGGSCGGGGGGGEGGKTSHISLSCKLVPVNTERTNMTHEGYL